MVWRLLTGALVGAVAGYLGHRLTAPAGGTCPLLCSPQRAVLLGAMVGLLWPMGAAPREAKFEARPLPSLATKPVAPEEVETMTKTSVAGVPVHVNESNFESLVKSAKTPILLDAYADWCGPCRRLAPELEEVAKELAGQVVVAKLNTDENPNLSAALRIQGIPALFVLDGNQVVDHWTGFRPADEIVARLKPHLRPAG